MLDRDPHFIKIINILEHRTFADVWRSCLPFSPLYLPAISDTPNPWVAVGKSTPGVVRLKAVGGILFNAIAVGLGLLTIAPLTDSIGSYGEIGRSISEFSIASFVGANLLDRKSVV